MSWFRRRRPIVFVFNEAAAGLGSTVMRGQQLADIARSAYRGERDVQFLPLGSAPAKADLFLTKGAVGVLTTEAAERLQRRGTRLFVDVLDVDPPVWAGIPGVNLVAASRHSFAEMRAELAANRVILVDHHADPRIPGFPAPITYRAGYFGELFNTIRSPALESRVDFVEVSTSRPSTDWLVRLPSYSLHFAVRRRIAQDAVKPLTKVFTAARCGANVVIGREDPELHYWLGDDYPYLTDGGDEDAIVATLDRARDDFGGSVWNQAESMMQRIADETSPHAIGCQLRVAFDER